MEIALMLEGQMGLTWPRWKRIVQAAEDLGFAGLYRSDHFDHPQDPTRGALELWVSLAWLADHTTRIEFGPLVAPVSFRHPALLVRQAAAVDDLSGGRLRLGLGAGWMIRDHESYSFDLLDVPSRFARFEEALRVVTALLRRDEPVTFEGNYYQFKDAVLIPRPARPGGPPIVIGGNGPQRTLPLAARFADEWNGVFITPQRYAELSGILDGLLREQGRAPGDVRRTLMTGLCFGRSEADLRDKLALYGASSVDEARANGIIAGHAAEVRAQLEQLAAAGVQRIMHQWLALDDLAGIEAFARAVL